MDRFVIVSGCSGGGKSSLVAELRRRGHEAVEEPGRRIVAQELATGGTALPWIDMAAFARRAVEVALEDRAAAQRLPGWVFFDRGLIDAAAGLDYATGGSALASLARQHPSHHRVFLVPPWPEIYVNDDERRHGFAEAAAEYERLARAYAQLGYEVVILPKMNVGTQANLVLAALSPGRGEVAEAVPPRPAAARDPGA